jgi:hypothetical protein
LKEKLSKSFLMLLGEEYPGDYIENDEDEDDDEDDDYEGGSKGAR